MGVTKKAKQIIAHLAEPNKGNMQATSIHTHRAPHGDTRSENVGKNSKSVSKPEANALPKEHPCHPTTTTPTSRPLPPVPSYTPLSSMATTPHDNDTAIRMISRKPTKLEDLATDSAKPGDKQPPPLNSIISSGPTLCEQVFGDFNDNREPQPHGSTAPGDSEQISEQAIDEQPMEIDEYAQEMEALRNSNYQRVAEIEKLKDDLQKEKERHAQTTQAWRKAAAALSANRPEANYKVDDDALRKDYENIVYDVHSWVATYGVSKFDHVPESDLNKFKMVSQHPQKYYHIERTRHLLLQSLVMHTLAELVMNEGPWWAGKHSDGLRKLQLDLERGTYHILPYISLVLALAGL